MACVFCKLFCKQFFRDPQNRGFARALYGDRGETDAGIWEREPDIRKLRSAYDALKSEPNRGLAELRDLAEAGSAMAMVYLGSAYEHGKGTDLDLAQAIAWYRRAAEKGYVGALAHLGVAFLNAKDYVAARDAFERGIAAKDRMSVYWLAHLLIHAPEQFRDLNENEARLLFEKASGWNNVYATRNLSSLYMRGRFGFLGWFRGLRLLFVGIRQMDAVIEKDKKQLARGNASERTVPDTMPAGPITASSAPS